MARALQKYHSFGHVYSSVEESQPESEVSAYQRSWESVALQVEGGQECEELEVAEETEGEVGAGDNQNDSDSKPEGESPTVNPSPPNTVTASPQRELEGSVLSVGFFFLRIFMFIRYSFAATPGSHSQRFSADRFTIDDGERKGELIDVRSNLEFPLGTTASLGSRKGKSAFPQPTRNENW